MDIERQVTTALARHPSVRAIHLAGSRQRGTPGPLSDWDFAVDVADFALVAADLPALVAPLQPLVQQWDPLDSKHSTYMLILPDPVKVDLIFDVPHVPAPPWRVSAETLQRIDDHFWDWLYWLASKDVAGKHQQVADELEKMHAYLLASLGAKSKSATVESAARLYFDLRGMAESRFTVAISRALEDAVRLGLRSAGYAV